MIVHKLWLQQRAGGRNNRHAIIEWEREGWFLFGFIPLFVRDRAPRGRYGKIDS